MKIKLILLILLNIPGFLIAQEVTAYKDFSIPAGKENECSGHQKYMELLDLKNFSHSTDSFSMRFLIWTLVSINSIFEIECVNGKWSGREILYGSRNRKGIGKCLYGDYKTVFKSYRISPIDSTWDYYVKILMNDFKLLSIRDQSEVDSAMNRDIADGIVFTLEVSTSKQYVYRSWSNPKHAPVKSFESETIPKIYRFFMDNFTSKLQRQRDRAWLRYLRKSIS